MMYLNKILICDQHGMLQMSIFMLNCSKEKVKNVTGGGLLGLHVILHLMYYFC